MKRCTLIVLLHLFLLANLNQIFSQAHLNKDVIFLIDLSSSMNKDQLFEKVKDLLNETLTEGIQIGDHVTILGFDSKVHIIAKKKIKNLNDRFELEGILSKLKAKGKWTYITNALGITAQELEEKFEETPNSIRIVYLFTDGKNDPPPDINNPITYDELINKYFKTFTRKNTFMYVFEFGVKDPKLGGFTKNTGGKKVNTPRDFTALITISPQNISIEKEVSSEVQEIIDTLHLEVGTGKVNDPINIGFSLDKNFELLKNNATIKKVGQQIELPIKLQVSEEDTLFGTLSLKYDESKSTKLIPLEIPVKYIITKVVGPKGTNDSIISTPLIIIIIVILIFVLIFLVCKFIMPKFSDGIELIVEDKKTNRNYGDYSLSDYNKFCFTSVIVGESKDIDVDLDGTILKLTPSKNGIQIKVVNGEVWDQFESDENLYSSGKSFKAFSDSEILTDSQKLKFNLEEDFIDDDEEDDLSENE